MPEYNVRIRLTDAKLDDYSRIKPHMLKMGFTKTITNISGQKYFLQLGEYDISSDASIEEIASAASRVLRYDKNVFLNLDPA